MVIENANVSFGNNLILEPSTLKVEDKGVTALLGRNGTGKTSVFNAIYGLIKIQDLAIFFNGTVIKKPYKVPGLINYIAQKKCHPKWLTVENVILSYGLHVNAFTTNYPIFKSCRQQKIGDLSYGTSRLLVTLAALEADVKFTVLDEPFSNVMPVHNELLLRTIKKVSTRKGILVSDHQFRTVLSVTDKLYLIVDKRIKLLNDPSDLITYGYLSKGVEV